jgi:hypothetical protein
VTRKQDLWENDPTLIPLSAKAKARVREAVFATLKRQGIAPDQLHDKDEGKDYAAWLAAQPQP